MKFTPGTTLGNSEKFVAVDNDGVCWVFNPEKAIAVKIDFGQSAKKKPSRLQPKHKK